MKTTSEKGNIEIYTFLDYFRSNQPLTIPIFKKKEEEGYLKRRSLKFFISFFSIFLSVLVFSLFFVFVIFCSIRSTSKQQNYDHHFTTIEEQRLLSENEDKFGIEEYKCSGKCYCDSLYDDINENERSTGVAITTSRKIFVFVAAMTSFLALRNAKEHFEEECIEIMSSDCEKTSILSEVEDCSTTKEVEKEQEKSTSSYRNDVEDEYLCSGRCMPVQFDLLLGTGKNEMMDVLSRTLQSKVDAFNCPSLSFDKKLKFGDVIKQFESQLKMDQQAVHTAPGQKTEINTEVALTKYFGGRKRVRSIERWFASSDLHNYCIMNSGYDLEKEGLEGQIVDNPIPVNDGGYDNRKKRRTSFCIGILQVGLVDNNINPTVTCKLIK